MGQETRSFFLWGPTAMALNPGQWTVNSVPVPQSPKICEFQNFADKGLSEFNPLGNNFLRVDIGNRTYVTPVILFLLTSSGFTIWSGSCMCVCMHICMSLCVCLCVYVCVCIYAHMYVSLCVCECGCVYMYAHMCLCVHGSGCVCHMCAHIVPVCVIVTMCMHMCVCTCVCVCMCVCSSWNKLESCQVREGTWGMASIRLACGHVHRGIFLIDVRRPSQILAMPSLGPGV